MEGYELMILSLIVGLALFTLASFGSDCNKDDKKETTNKKKEERRS